MNSYCSTEFNCENIPSQKLTSIAYYKLGACKQCSNTLRRHQPGISGKHTVPFRSFTIQYEKRGTYRELYEGDLSLAKFCLLIVSCSGHSWCQPLAGDVT